eukprot:TRINITY_DN1982_c0_g1_i1.p1 TRINITY_DN1982_c0_g1~~TRINITY_DN1982_c0_g1_i1.p1  ORF type:complete len:251 (-),score=74.74 TRINITY_DN1982_c0_g1_i1:12-764(-)
MARYYLKQLISALEYMHSKGFAHRDIKAENLLMDLDCNLKLADFGYSTSPNPASASAFHRTPLGTEGYMAPEINKHLPYNPEKADIFAVGVLLFIMVTGLPPFRRAAENSQLYQMLCNKNAEFWKYTTSKNTPTVFSDDLISIVNQMLSSDPNKRGQFNTLKNHPWVKDKIPSIEEVKVDFANRHAKIEKERNDKMAEALQKKLDKMKLNTKFGGSIAAKRGIDDNVDICLLYTSPSPRDQRGSRMPSSA